MKTIRASEVGEYVYCARAWWMRRELGLEPAGSERRELGTALHSRHGRTVVFSGTLFVVGVLLLIVAIGLLVWR